MLKDTKAKGQMPGKKGRRLFFFLNNNNRIAHLEILYNLLTAPRTVSKHVRSSGPGAIVCKSRTTHPALITCNKQCAT